MLQWNQVFGCTLVLALAALSAAAPVNAQERERQRERPTSEYRERAGERDGRPQLRRRGRGDQRDDRRERAARRDGRRVPPGWCLGRGNPHSTPENCGYDARHGRDARWESVTRREGSDPSGERYGSYDEAHAAFHRELDRRYTLLAAEHPGDAQYQRRLRAQKQAEHERWHARRGVRHDGRGL